MDNIKAIERSIITNFENLYGVDLLREFRIARLIEPSDKIAVYISGGKGFNASCKAITGITETWQVSF